VINKEEQSGYSGCIVEELEIADVLSKSETKKIEHELKFKRCNINELPKFHDRTSLLIGMIASFVLVLLSLIEAIQDFKLWLLYPMCLGIVLRFHCLDMIRYYKSHRIVKIVKTDTERLVYKK
jgi:hypothetical protein